MYRKGGGGVRDGELGKKGWDIGSRVTKKREKRKRKRTKKHHHDEASHAPIEEVVESEAAEVVIAGINAVPRHRAARRGAERRRRARRGRRRRAARRDRRRRSARRRGRRRGRHRARILERPARQIVRAVGVPPRTRERFVHGEVAETMGLLDAYAAVLIQGVVQRARGGDGI